MIYNFTVTDLTSQPQWKRSAEFDLSVNILVLPSLAQAHLCHDVAVRGRHITVITYRHVPPV